MRQVDKNTLSVRKFVTSIYKDIFPRTSMACWCRNNPVKGTKFRALQSILLRQQAACLCKTELPGSSDCISGAKHYVE